MSSGKVKVEVTHQMVTVTMVKRWLEERKYEVDGSNLQRKVKPPHVEELTQLIVRGELVPANTKIQFCRCDGKYYNTDGQHTMLAILAANKRKPAITGVMANVEICYCSNMEEVARIYATADIGVMRTQGDALRAAGIAKEFDVSDVAVNKVGSAVGLIIAGFSRPTTDAWKLRNRDVKLAAVREWMPLAQQYFDCVKTQKGFTKVMRKASFVAIGMTLLKFQPDKAKEFLLGVADDSGLDRADPRKALREQLLKLEARNGVQLRKEQEARYIAYAWNNFYRGHSIKQFKIGDPDEPIKLLGTKYDGESVKKMQV